MREILERLAKGEITVDEAETALKFDHIEKISDFARIDTAREIRRGIPEIVFAEGKTAAQIFEICDRMLAKSNRAIISRLNHEMAKELASRYERSNTIREFKHSRSLVISTRESRPNKTGGRVGILTAGTVDLPIAEDAQMVLEELGCEAFLESDVGVAGIHRLTEPLKEMIRKDVDCLIVVAGREGALPTVVAGLVDIPIIGVPASSGYGYGGRGQAALMAMLQACSLGLAVVNIDSGIAAGIVAGMIANRVARARANSLNRT